MPQAYDTDVLLAAEALYVDEGATYERVAAETGAALNTVKAWGKKYGWKELREQRALERRTLAENFRRLRHRLMGQALENPDPQAVFAVIRLEKLALDREQARRRDAGTGQAAPDLPRIFLESLEFVARTLKDLDPEGLKILARNFDAIVTRWKAEHEAKA